LRAGEGAGAVAEQFGLDQRFGQAGAVDRHEGAAARGLADACTARAKTSLPVPVSPHSSTGVWRAMTRAVPGGSEVP
jgi:hypothetical protein